MMVVSRVTLPKTPGQNDLHFTVFSEKKNTFKQGILLRLISYVRICYSYNNEEEMSEVQKRRCFI